MKQQCWLWVAVWDGTLSRNVSVAASRQSCQSSLPHRQAGPPGKHLLGSLLLALCTRSNRCFEPSQSTSLTTCNGQAAPAQQMPPARAPDLPQNKACSMPVDKLVPCASAATVADLRCGSSADLANSCTCSFEVGEVVQVILWLARNPPPHPQKNTCSP